MSRVSVPCVLALLPLLSLLPARAGDAPPLLAAYRTPVLDANRARAVGPVSARHGRLEIEMKSGTAVPIVAGAETVGVLLDGDGVWRYAVDDPECAATFKDNVIKIAPALTTTADRITDRFGRAIVFFAVPAFQPFWEPDAARAALPAGAEASLRKQLELMDLHWITLEHQLPRGRFDETPYVYAEFEGKLRAGYIYDVLDGYEELLDFRQLSGIKKRVEEKIARQRIGEGPQPDVVLEHADVAADTPDNRSGTIRAVLRLRARRDVRFLLFNLFNHRNPQTWYWESKRNALTVRSLTRADGTPIPFSHRCMELLADLGSPLRAGETIELHFAADGEVFTGPGGHRYDNHIEFYSEHWFPTPPAARHNRFTFTLEVRTRKPFRPVSSGDVTHFAEEGQHYVLRAKSDVPVWDLGFMAGKYKIHEVRHENYTIRVHAYGVVSVRDVERLGDTAKMFLRILVDRLGPPPWSEIDIVEVPSFLLFEFSPPGVVVITTEAFHIDDAKIGDYLAAKGAYLLLAHELAHQWFGHAAWPTIEEDNWLTESLAEYVAGLALSVAEKTEKLDPTRFNDFREQKAYWRTWAGDVEDVGTLRAANHIEGPARPSNRFFQLYCRGPLVLQMFHGMIGDAAFDAVLHKYLADAAAGPTSTERFVAAANAVTGQDWSWYFEQWLRQPGTPEVKVAHKVREGDGGAPVLVVDVGQSTAFKKVHIPLVVEYGDGRREELVAVQDQRTQSFTFPLAGKPTKVSVDPGRNNLVDYR